MNAFERHGIGHLSASSLNQFAAQPAYFVAQRLLGRKTSVGAAAHRGTAIEDGVKLGLTAGVDDEECVAEALRVYRERTVFCGDADRAKQEAAVAPTVATALAELRPYGPDVECQERIEWRGEGIEIPFIGYIDFRWPRHGILIDLKTTLNLKSAITAEHARQVALYCGAVGNNVSAGITYATPRKVATYRLENEETHRKGLVRIAESLRRFLNISADPYELVGITVPDLNHFYWSGPEARSIAWDLWGI